MASAAQSLRVCLRTASRHVAPSPAQAISRQCIAPRAVIRPFSSTPIARRKDEDDGESLEEPSGEEGVSPFTPEEYERYLREFQQDGGAAQERAMRAVEKSKQALDDFMKPKQRLKAAQRKTLWNEDEDDSMLTTEEFQEDDFEEDDIMGMAHAKLEEHREYREYARIAAWQMPLLSKLAVPFQPPTAQEPLRFRYTSYMGELHPAEPKVVVEFSPRDMQLSEPQQMKLRKLLGPRLNPETDIAKMSCEQFDHPAQNKRYLADVVNKLLVQAKDSSDMFEDVPLDTRHHTVKVKPKFPKEWRLTEERQKFIEDSRRNAYLLDQAKEEQGALISGTEKIELYFNRPVPVQEFARPARLGAHQLPAAGMARRPYARR